MSAASQLVRFALAFWVGGTLLVVIAAPVVFRQIASRDLAGSVFGEILRRFEIVKQGLSLALVIGVFVALEQGLRLEGRSAAGAIAIFVAIATNVYLAMVLRPRMGYFRDKVGSFDAAAPDGPGAGFALYAAELITARLGTGSARSGAPVELPSRYPTVAADLTLTHVESVPWAEIAAAVEAARPPHLVEFGLRDRYTGEGVPAGAVNTTLGFLYGSRERSLTQEEVNAAQEALAARLRERFGLQDRG